MPRHVPQQAPARKVPGAPHRHIGPDKVCLEPDTFGSSTNIPLH
ncbi:hypothetical protein [Marivita sp.]|nr:hypothetical protein [Marivita sp.]